MQLTLRELFGEGSYQDGEKVVIDKRSLPFVPLPNNSAQSLFAALLEKARFNFHGQLSGNEQLLTVGGNESLEFNNSNDYEYLQVLYTRNDILFNGGKQYYGSIYKVKFLLIEQWQVMEIKDLPEVTAALPDDWLIVQRGTLTAKIKYSKLAIAMQPPIDDNDDNDNGGGNNNGGGNETPITTDEDDIMYFGTSSPDNPTMGKMWGEINTLNQFVETWIYQYNLQSNSNEWMTDIRTARFTLTPSNSRFLMKLDTRRGYLLKGIDASFVGINGETDCYLQIRAGGDKDISSKQPLDSLYSYLSSSSSRSNYKNISNAYINTVEPSQSDDGFYPGVYLVEVKPELSETSVNYEINGFITYQIVKK